MLQPTQALPHSPNPDAASVVYSPISRASQHGFRPSSASGFTPRLADLIRRKAQQTMAPNGQAVPA